MAESCLYNAPAMVLDAGTARAWRSFWAAALASEATERSATSADVFLASGGADERGFNNMVIKCNKSNEII